MSEQKGKNESVTPRKRRIRGLIAATAAVAAGVSPFVAEGLSNHNKQQELDRQEFAAQKTELQAELDGKLGPIAEQIAAVVLKQQESKGITTGELAVVVPESRFSGELRSLEVRYNKPANGTEPTASDVAQVYLTAGSTGESTAGFFGSTEYVLVKSQNGWEGHLILASGSKNDSAVGGMSRFDASTSFLENTPKEKRGEVAGRVGKNADIILSGQEGLFDPPVEMAQQIIADDGK